MEVGKKLMFDWQLNDSFVSWLPYNKDPYVPYKRLKSDNERPGTCKLNHLVEVW